MCVEVPKAVEFLRGYLGDHVTEVHGQSRFKASRATQAWPGTEANTHRCTLLPWVYWDAVQWGPPLGGYG